jgi:hypothetical protein
MKKFSFLLVFTIILYFLAAGLADAATSNRYQKKRSMKAKGNKTGVVRSETGLNIPKWGLAIDAIFDPRLDDIIPGYHIINLVVTNRRAEPIVLNAKLDKWIVIDHIGKKHTAQNHVKFFNRKLWPLLPDKLKQMLDYPHQIGAGKSVSIDVFMSKSVDLFNFKEVIWRSAHFNKEFTVFTNYEDNIKVPNNSHELDVEQKPKNLYSDDNTQNNEEMALPNKYRTKRNRTKVGEVKEKKVDDTKFNPNLDDLIIIR